MKTQGLSLKAIIILGFAIGLPAALTAAFPAAADMSGHGGMVRALDVSPDGRRVLSGSFDFTARLWNFSEQIEIGVLDAHAGPVTNVAFVGNGDQALTASDDRTAILWNLKTLKPVKRLIGHTHKVMGLAVTKDGKRAATGSWDKTVRLWDLGRGETVKTFSTPSPVNAVAFADGGKILIAGGHDGKIRVWNTVTGRAKATLEGHELGITGLSVDSNGRLLSASIDKTLRLWDLKTMREVRVLKDHDSPVYAAVFAPDGKTALSAGREGTLLQWNLADGRPLRAIRAVRSQKVIIWAVGFSADGRFALTGGSDDLIRVWHLQSGDRIGLEAEGEDEPKPWLTSDHPGAPLFKKCARCHSLSTNGKRRSGPHLAGLFGRSAGSVEGYNYSAALTGVDFKWNEKTLFQLFDKGPNKVLPGTKMPMQMVPDAEKLTQLVDYLKQITAKATRE